MNSFKELVQKRRSYRNFTNEEIDSEDVKLILRAALMSPTSKGRRSWHFIVVDDKMAIEKLSDAKDMGAKFLAKSSLAIVVLVSHYRMIAGLKMELLQLWQCSFRLKNSD